MENSPFTDDFPIKTAMCRGFQLPRLLPRGEVVPHVKIWTPFRRFHRPAKPQLENHWAKYIQIRNIWLRKIMNGCMSLEISYIILYVILYHIYIYNYIHIMYSIFPNNHWSTMSIPISWVLGNMKSQLHHDFTMTTSFCPAGVPGAGNPHLLHFFWVNSIFRHTQIREMVVSNHGILYDFPETVGNFIIPTDLTYSYFSRWLKPPTRISYQVGLWYPITDLCDDPNITGCKKSFFAGEIYQIHMIFQWIYHPLHIPRTFSWD